MGRVFSLKDSKTYDSRSFAKMHKITAETLSKKIPKNLIEGSVILDIGCGTGASIEGLLYSKPKIIIGIDPSKYMLDKAEKNLKNKNFSRNIDPFSIDSGIVLLDASGEKMPLSDSSIDHAFAISTLEHVEDIAAVIAEVSRVLKPNGFFGYNYIEKKNVDDFCYGYICNFYEYINKSNGIDYCVPSFSQSQFDKEKILSIAQERGLKIVSEESKELKVDRAYLWRYITPIIKVSKIASCFSNIAQCAKFMFNKTINQKKASEYFEIGKEYIFIHSKI